MESLKNVYCEKMGLFRFLAEKIFSVAAREVARRWSARSACKAFRAASVCVWMDAMEVVHV